MKLLNDVIRDHAQDDERIRQALEVGDVQEARSRAHGLKGVAGNLSMGPLREAAAELEAAIVELKETPDFDRSSFAPMIARMRTALEEVTNAVRAMAEASDADDEMREGPGIGAALDPARIVEIAGQIQSAADIGDIAAAQEAIQSLPAGSADRLRLARFSDAFDLHGLEAAARELEQTASRTDEETTQ